jgi:hypothetical protein
MRRAGLVAVLVLASTAMSSSPLDAVRGGQQLPSEPMRQFGQSVTGAFEGWYQNADGSYTFLVGYLNRNFAQPVEVPIGPNNRIEPGGPDMGQPAFFLPGRQYGMFTIRVPKDFSAQQRLTWTLTVNGQTTSIPLRLNPDYVVQPFADVAVKNTPPVLRLEEKGATIQGPVATVSTARSGTARVGTPVTITVWAEDDEKFSSGNNAPQRNPPPPVVLTWSKYRGPAAVKFDKESPPFEKLTGSSAAFSGKSTVRATFSEPGDYILHVTANDYSGEGGGGEVCCWTTAMVKVSVAK